MNWEAIGAISEFVGAAAVLVSILYLAAQIRQGASDVRANIIHALHSKEVDVTALPATIPVLGLAVFKAHTGGELTEEERAVYTSWLYAVLVNAHQTYIEYVRLEVDPDIIESERVRLAATMEPPLAQAVWRRMNDRFTPDFRTYVRAQVMNGEARVSLGVAAP